MTGRVATEREGQAYRPVAPAALDVATAFLRGTFPPTDRLAVVLLSRVTGGVTQRLVTAATLASPRWQGWLRAMNAQRHDVFLSLNALAAHARRRTKRDIVCVRHLLLDLDHDADRVLATLRCEAVLPVPPIPHHIVRSSPQRCQVLWRVTGMTPAAAERYQRALALRYGGDLAATDSARVSRWPGFRNHKYASRPFVTVSSRTLPPCGPEAFAQLDGSVDVDSLVAPTRPMTPRGCSGRPGGSQSERDWQWAVRRLAAGAPIQQLERLLAVRRRDKHQPADYAARTVDAAWVELALRAGRAQDALVRELSARRYARLNAAAYAAAIVSRAVARSHRSSVLVRG